MTSLIRKIWTQEVSSHPDFDALIKKYREKLGIPANGISNTDDANEFVSGPQLENNYPIISAFLTEVNKLPPLINLRQKRRVNINEFLKSYLVLGESVLPALEGTTEISGCELERADTDTSIIIRIGPYTPISEVIAYIRREANRIRVMQKGLIPRLFYPRKDQRFRLSKLAKRDRQIYELSKLPKSKLEKKLGWQGPAYKLHKYAMIADILKKEYPSITNAQDPTGLIKKAIERYRVHQLFKHKKGTHN